MSNRPFNPVDHAIEQFDQGLRTLFGRPHTTARENPAVAVNESALDDGARQHAAGLMRVNHAGEVCAQALYQGQALTARNDHVKKQMEHSAQEENDHLDWCQSRLNELDSHASYLNPLWYTGSLAIGALAGLAGDKWSLGFVVETENQVGRHLEEHLEKLPAEDQRSRAILEQMKIDEAQHAATAQNAGAAELPKPVQQLMKLTSKIMTSAAYRA